MRENEIVKINPYMRGSRKFCQRGSNSIFNFDVFRGFFFVFLEEEKNITIIREKNQIPLSAGHHRPASKTPFKWRFAGVPVMAKH